MVGFGRSSSLLASRGTPHEAQGRTALALAALTLLVLQVGCAAGPVTDGDGSRAVHYDSIDALAKDSAAMVIGTVTDQRTEGETTISTLEVLSSPSSAQLGVAAPEAEPVSAGDTVAVRQDPSSRPLLESGKEYALWLTPTMLGGDAADDFFITGSNAGMYVVDGNIAYRVVTEAGDRLPATIEIAGRP